MDTGLGGSMVIVNTISQGKIESPLFVIQYMGMQVTSHFALNSKSTFIPMGKDSNKQRNPIIVEGR